MVGKLDTSDTSDPKKTINTLKALMMFFYLNAQVRATRIKISQNWN